METRYTFSKKEKLCLKERVKAIFDNGRWLRSEHLRLVYLVSDQKLPVPVQILFSVPKKNHRRAVKRNLLKRRMREVYRLNKPGFYESLAKSDKQLLIGVVYSSSKVCNYQVIQNELKSLLHQVCTRVNKSEI